MRCELVVGGPGPHSRRPPFGETLTLFSVPREAPFSAPHLHKACVRGCGKLQLSTFQHWSYTLNGACSLNIRGHLFSAGAKPEAHSQGGVYPKNVYQGDVYPKDVYQEGVYQKDMCLEGRVLDRRVSEGRLVRVACIWDDTQPKRHEAKKACIWNDTQPKRHAAKKACIWNDTQPKRHAAKLTQHPEQHTARMKHRTKNTANTATEPETKNSSPEWHTAREARGQDGKTVRREEQPEERNSTYPDR
ncbi:hypothetical protein BO78DRAFT_443905 [Aspergillus sclerotiicarbonarius CBS 121057]|uniref:Uncharacterized protein n=1 Tax=Aspergillus sclerotiicarbonarius (strain CBS 121057 / IBT 28362) TaxID=1448318 RepID=A0A319ER38_ASPSB|nr:hypothetical protein BO78DRAFT_443905 [Aspergillus sclerotiicarbonarius CBS 121057]